MKKPREIVAERIVLKSLRDFDEANMVEMLLDSKIKKTYMIPDLLNSEEQHKFFERLKRASELEEHFTYGVFLNDEVIGFLNDVEIKDDEIEVGYFISSKHWGNGYATEALKAAIEALFVIGFKHVVAGYFIENLASARVMEKAGMHKIDKTDDIEYRGEIKHCRYYLVSRE